MGCGVFLVDSPALVIMKGAVYYEKGIMDFCSKRRLNT
jgi:hypothetical protein